MILRMPEIQLVPPCSADAEEVLAFEIENRAFFESHINARAATYYSLGGVSAAIELAMREANEDKAYQYLVRDRAGTMVGRANLTRVRRAHFHSAELGYRVAQSACGNGHASEAVRQVLAKAFDEIGLARIEATARPENEGSIRVLNRNGFTQFGRSTKSFELAGVWHDLLHFERHAEA